MLAAVTVRMCFSAPCGHHAVTVAVAAVTVRSPAVTAHVVCGQESACSPGDIFLPLYLPSAPRSSPTIRRGRGGEGRGKGRRAGRREENEGDDCPRAWGREGVGNGGAREYWKAGQQITGRVDEGVWGVGKEGADRGEGRETGYSRRGHPGALLRASGGHLVGVISGPSWEG